MDRLQDRFWSPGQRGDPLGTEGHFGRPPVRRFGDLRRTFRDIDGPVGRAAGGSAALVAALERTP